MNASTCAVLFKGHCSHWGLTEAQHALLHAQGRMIAEVAAEDVAAGIDLRTGDSSSSIADDGPRLEALLRDEGYMVVPITRTGH